MVSPRPSWVVAASMMIGWPPSSAMPASKDSLVRVEGFSKMTATDLGPSSGRAANGSFFIRSASSRIAVCSSAVMSSSTRKWRGWAALNAGFPFSAWGSAIARSRRRLRSAGDFRDPGQQLGDAERLEEDGVLSEDVLHRGYGLDLAGDDAYGDVGERRVTAQLFAHPYAAQVRHHQVEQDHRGAPTARLHQAGQPVQGDGDVVALRRQQGLQQAADARVVLDDQDMRRAHRGVPSPAGADGAVSWPTLTAAAAESRIAGSASVKRCACAAERIRGGASRTASGATALTRNPASRAACSTAAALPSSTTNASQRPRPRTSCSSGAVTADRAVHHCSPRVVTWSSRPSRSMTVSTARRAAHETGLPPNVEPWSPFCNAPEAAPAARQAPIGSPPPSPFARVTTSGRTLSCWWANHAPVRAMPPCTSSRTSSAPCRSQVSRAALR